MCFKLLNTYSLFLVGSTLSFKDRFSKYKYLRKMLQKHISDLRIRKIKLPQGRPGKEL